MKAFLIILGVAIFTLVGIGAILICLLLHDVRSALTVAFVIAAVDIGIAILTDRGPQSLPSEVDSYSHPLNVGDGAWDVTKAEYPAHEHEPMGM